jgi:pilus assembly protein Flp/PilA
MAVGRRLFCESGRLERLGMEYQAQLFGDLAAERNSRNFLAFYLAARELPLSGVALVRQGLLQQQSPLPITDRRCDHRHDCRQIFHLNLTHQRFVRTVLRKSTHRTAHSGGKPMRGSQFVRRLLRDTRGATAIEYGLIVSLIVIAMFGALRGVADENNGMWAKVRNEVLGASS